MTPSTTEVVEEITAVANEQQHHVKTREKAAEFLEGRTVEEISFSYKEEKAVLHRIDKRVLVLILWAYFFQQLDKSSLR